LQAVKEAVESIDRPRDNSPEVNRLLEAYTKLIPEDMPARYYGNRPPTFVLMELKEELERVSAVK
jgi:hypothetical protein